MNGLPQLLFSYWQTRRLRFASRGELLTYQQHRLQQFAHDVLAKSPYFQAFASRPMADWPRMDKALMMAHFDTMNTAGLRLADVVACARAAERSRDFRPVIAGCTVGLSSGTSGGRGVFVVSPQERAQWAGILLAKLLPRGLFQRERIALFLRANSNLYTTVRTPLLRFEFFDLFQPFESHLGRLAELRPTVLVGPAQVLRALAAECQAGRLAIAPRSVLSAAEVLQPQDRAALESTFARVGEIYQATEGFLGATCPHGTLHLNEERILVEPEWLDDRRFVPVITDFTRRTQPIVRYRLDDILVARAANAPACPCSNPALAIEHIEGRCDDLLLLPGAGGQRIRIFADVCNRALAQQLPLRSDYRLIQMSERSLMLSIQPADAALQRQCQDRLSALFAREGVATSDLHWMEAHESARPDFTVKQRRIQRRRAVQ